MSAREWTPSEYKKIVEMRNELIKNGDHSWEPMAKEFNVSKQNALAAYRRAVGAKHGSVKDKTEYQEKEEKEQPESKTYEQGDDFINVICSSKRMLTKDDIIKEFKIDLDVWEVDRFKVKTSEGYRKDRKVQWEVTNGKVTSGSVDDSGKMLVVPLYHLEVRFKKKVKDTSIDLIGALIEDAKKYAPHYPKINYPTYNDGLLYEVDMFDIHIGRLSWDDESSQNYDLKLAQLAVESTLVKLLSLINGQPIKKILLPLGNDFFNVDNKFNTTTKGTLQQEDTRWQKTFKKGREICVWMIDACSQIAPVDVLMIPGNHDQQRSFYLGDSLYSWYHNSQDVKIDNSAMAIKYYDYGNTLLGFTHGDDTNLKDLPLRMAVDVPDMWAKSKYREWHTGDKHHKKDIRPDTDESTGMVVRILRALTAYDAWTFNKGYRSLRSGESFLWTLDKGLTAQYTALPDIE